MTECLFFQKELCLTAEQGQPPVWICWMRDEDETGGGIFIIIETMVQVLRDIAESLSSH